MPNIAYKAICGGTCLDDLELLHNDEGYLDVLDAQRIPDPTTAGNFPVQSSCCGVMWKTRTVRRASLSSKRFPMRGFALLLSLLLPGVVAGQTLGVSGVNNYWITPGGTPGGFSCKAMNFVTPNTMSMNVSAAPSTPFYVFWFTCPCVACMQAPAMGISSCLPPPTSACPASNQFLEVGVINPCQFLFALPSLTNSAGLGTIQIPVPLATSPFLLSTQTVFLGPATCVVSPWSLLFSQGWNVTFV